jgi:hypothetical protein
MTGDWAVVTEKLPGVVNNYSATINMLLSRMSYSAGKDEPCARPGRAASWSAGRRGRRRSRLRCVWTYLVPKKLDHWGFSVKIYGPEPDKSKRIVGSGRIVASEREAPNVLVSLV